MHRENRTKMYANYCKRRQRSERCDMRASKREVACASGCIYGNDIGAGIGLTVPRVDIKLRLLKAL